MPVAAQAKPQAAPKADAKSAPRKPGRGPPRTPFGLVQAKMALGPAQDIFERQADNAATHVMANRPGVPTLTGVPVAGMAQRACATCDDELTSRRVQRSCACGAGPTEPCSCNKTEDEHPELQVDRAAKSEPRRDALGAVESVLREPGKPLPTPVRRDMEQGFGRSFSHVRVHDNPRAAGSAEGIGAHAYTVGNHIAFNRGKYQPTTDTGRFLLAHELAHTVQQSGAPPATGARISQPGDRHEAQANRAASAVTQGGAMPALTSGAAPISRYDWRDAVGDVAEGAAYGLGGPIGGYIFGDDARELAVDTAESVIDFGSEIYQTAVAIAAQYGVGVRIDGTTLVIDLPEFDPCEGSGLEFALRLSDLGLDPTLWFPLGPPLPFFTVGIVTLAGQFGVSVNLDPGLGFALDNCSFGPGQIRINPLTASASISGELSMTTASMVQLGADLGLTATAVAIIAWPDPPIVLAVPLIGLELGGSLEFMLQNRGTMTTQFTANANLGGVAGAMNFDADVGYGLDLSYGLYGAVNILGQQLCRVGWPLDSYHADIATNVNLRAAASLDSSGLNFSYLPTVTPLGTNPLDDLSFAFDESRMEDDCWLCEFLNDHELLPSYSNKDWAHKVGSYPLLAGPETDIFQRDPGITSKAKCRGTCGPDCAEGSCDNNRRPLVVCENVGDSHVWHTYVGYETCGTHQGCRDHDACYDFAADEPIWGFGGYMVGPMYRACDLDAMCDYGFQTSVGWAGGNGPYDRRLRYADYAYVTPGCLGPCPEASPDGEGGEVEQTCLPALELLSGVSTQHDWGEEFFNDNVVSGSVPVPYIGRLTYGANALARADGEVFAEIGPVNLANACLVYDPATKTYTGTADLMLLANLGASASITAALEGFLSDPLCFLNWITLRGTLNAGIIAQLPTEFTAGVDLYCQNGDLMVLPRVSMNTCLDVSAELNAGLDVFLLSFNVWGKEWQLAKQTIQTCWDMELTFDPFLVGDMPSFDLVSAVGALDTLLDALFPAAGERNIDRTPARNPLPAAPRLLFPCLGGGGDDDGDDDDGPSTVNCPVRATGADGRRIHPNAADRGPHYPSTGSISIPGGGMETVGHIMEAPFLEATITGGSTPGTQNSIYGNPGIPTEGCFTASKKDTQRFVKGHLLNHNIGGPGRGDNGRKNLFPITGQMNANHKNTVEQSGENVVGRVKNDELIYYKVTVSSDMTPRQITNPTTGVGHEFYDVRSTFLCEVGDYQLCDDDTLQPNPTKTVPITQDFVFHPPGGNAFDTITDPDAC